MNNKIYDLFVGCGVLNNFPYPIDDFDKLTEYEMLLECIKKIKKLFQNDETLTNRINVLYEYITNLDLQDEVDHKIDEMLESGQLQEIITSYLQINGVLGYDTVSAMVSATNIIDGSICRTLGLNTYNDGKGAFYKIRTITSGDTVDGVNIIALNVSDTLIAEKMPDYYLTKEITDRTNADTNLQNQINSISDEQIIFLGDSFGAGSSNSWVKTYCDINNLTLNTNAFNFCNGGAGFTITDNTYLSNLQSNESVITDKNKVKKIIVCGGWNDRANATAIESAIETLMTYLKTNYPKAKVYCGMLANYGNIDDTAGSLYWRNVLTGTILDKYRKIIKYGGYYLTGVEQVLHNYSLISEDYIHPNNNGYAELGYAISQAVNTGSYNINENLIFYTQFSSDTMTLNTTDVVNTSNLILNQVIKYGEINTISFGQINVNNKNSLYTELNINVGTFTNSSFNYFRFVNAYSGISGLCKIKYDTNKYVIAPYKISFNRNASVTINVKLENDITNVSEFVPISFDKVNILNN